MTQIEEVMKYSSPIQQVEKRLSDKSQRRLFDVATYVTRCRNVGRSM